MKRHGPTWKLVEGGLGSKHFIINFFCHSFELFSFALILSNNSPFKYLV